MINIILDTLVFGLQKMGGVSVVWCEYIERMLHDNRVKLTLLDIEGDYINYAFRKMNTQNAMHIKEKGNNLQVLRNVSPRITDQKEMTIFQSTYLRTCKRKNVKNVVMIHDITHQLYFSGVKRWLNTLQKKRAIASADGIICVSENTLRDLQRYFPQSRTITSTVIYNSASQDYHPVDKVSLPDRYKELNEKSYVIYVGDRFKYKNTNILFEIIKKYDNLHCVLIGGSDYSDEEKLLMRGIESRVHHYTKVSNYDLNLLYNMAHCMIYPSLYEGFGIPVLEAMNSGCPVIAFNNSSISEVLRGSGILLENNDCGACLNAIEKLYNNEARKNIIDEELAAAKYFQWDKSYGKLIRFYEQVLEQ